jgi:hypothetical protein
MAGRPADEEGFVAVDPFSDWGYAFGDVEAAVREKRILSEAQIAEVFDPMAMTGQRPAP